MAEKFLMPALSPTMEEGQIARWVKNEGDTFEASESLAEVDTDKATMEMTALGGGTLLKILKREGETAALGEPIAIIGKAGEDISSLLSEIGSNGKSAAAAASTGGTATAAKAAPEPKAETRAVASVSPAKPQSVIPSPQANGGRMIVSPIAARMAAMRSW